MSCELFSRTEDFHTFTVARSLFRTQTPRANVSWQKLNSLHISPSHRITSCSWNGVMSVPCVRWKESRGQNFAGVCGECVRLCQTLGSVKIYSQYTWMQLFLKTGTFQRRISLPSASSNNATNRWFSAAPGFFIVTLVPARVLHHLRRTHRVVLQAMPFTVGEWNGSQLNTTSYVTLKVSHRYFATKPFLKCPIKSPRFSFLLHKGLI